jgi:hypothetical protein
LYYDLYKLVILFSVMKIRHLTGNPVNRCKTLTCRFELQLTGTSFILEIKKA